MKRANDLWIGTCVLLAAALLAAAPAVYSEGGRRDEREERGEHGHRAAAGGGATSHVVIKMRRVAVPRPERIATPEHVVREDRRIALPQHDGSGASVAQHPRTTPPGHATVVRNAPVVRAIERDRRFETEKGRYYWHADAGVKYSHYYDSFGVHWYGFYNGPDFYWTRYHANRWWWWDASFTRWVFWYNGYWWWQSPAGVAYVYMDNNYYPYESAAGAVTVKTPEVQAPANTEPPLAAKDGSWMSPDGSRMILTAEGGEAFLYDHSGSGSVFMKYLGRGVQKARFSGGTNGKPLSILLEFSDGTFALFDAQGQSLDVQPGSAASGDLPGPPPIVAPPSAGAPTAPPSPPAQPQ